MGWNAYFHLRQLRDILIIELELYELNNRFAFFLSLFVSEYAELK